MAALFIVAGLAIADKVEKKKEAKRQKKALDEARYRELQIETSQRLARTQSGTIIEGAFSEEDGEEHEESAADEDARKVAVDDVAPPAYEDAVASGERQEKEWRARMTQRRRSSVLSRSSRGDERVSGGSGSNMMRMG